MDTKEVGAPVPSNTGLASKLASAKEAVATAGAAALGASSGGADKTAIQKAFKSMTTNKTRPTKPKLAPGEVLFISSRPTLGCQVSAIKTIRFVDGYYATADSAEISFLRKNAEHFSVSEDKTKA